MLLLDHKSRLPIYTQLYQEILRLSALGAMVPGEQLPSVRALAQELGVNPNTVQKAYQLLEHDGYICSVPGKGSFLCDMGDEAAKKKREAKQALEHAIRSALENAVNPDEIRALVERILTGGEAT
ncbi:MAG TPA: GntR family transcriptional regulator [Candidatus Caccousia stercoris]|uniref:GntR family transcriptional regulator n=1 Tax=Candidatus Caccousia stercoris TaxID=2840723 RepID=A0A9D1FU09_9FIRM|nr:GntR family transcriptional regulator [Candidatus Caccousia stercoris]